MHGVDLRDLRFTWLHENKYGCNVSSVLALHNNFDIHILELEELKYLNYLNRVPNHW